MGGVQREAGSTCRSLVTGPQMDLLNVSQSIWHLKRAISAASDGHFAYLALSTVTPVWGTFFIIKKFEFLTCPLHLYTGVGDFLYKTTFENDKVQSLR